jgi:hypothetical protein
MRARVEYAEYLGEVRERVCPRCPERLPDGPPYRPSCRRCGVELQLPHLVESVRAAGGRLSRPGVVPDRREVCATCFCLDGPHCPCPAGFLLALIVRAVQAVDEHREQRELLRRREARLARRERVPVAEMVRAYEEATGTCVGCD